MRKIDRILKSATFALAFVVLTACVAPPAAEENKNAGNANASQQSQSGTGLIKAQTGLGNIQIVSKPAGASIILISDEEGGAGQPQPRGTTPTTLTDIAPGKYAVHLEMPGFKPFQKSIEVKPDETVTVKTQLRKR